MDETTPKRKRGRPKLTPEQLAERRALPPDQQPARGMGGKHNFPHTQPLNVEPGDHARFLNHALRVRDLPHIDVTDPIQVKNRITEYFNLCVEDDVKPSVKGFLNALRIGRTTLWQWKQGGYRANTHQAIVCEAFDVLEALWEDYMQNGKINPVSGIFLGKNNFGYKDQQEYVLTPNQNGVQEIDTATIEAKYAELPEE